MRGNSRLKSAHRMLEFGRRRYRVGGGIPQSLYAGVMETDVVSESYASVRRDHPIFALKCRSMNSKRARHVVVS